MINRGRSGGLMDGAENHGKHRMSAAQNAKYWREWGKAERAARRHGVDLDRHAIHVQALGFDKSHVAFTNKEFDQVLQEFYAVSQPANLDLQLRQQDQGAARLRWRIRQFAPESYTRHLLSTRFREHLAAVQDQDGMELARLLECLDEVSLRQLRDTLAARASRSRLRPMAQETDESEDVADVDDQPLAAEAPVEEAVGV